MLRKSLAALFALDSLFLAPAQADQITDNARAIWRDWTVDGVPSSGPWNPRKGDIRNWGALVGSSISALQAAQTGAALAFDTKANLDASLAYAANTQAFVYADGTPSNNGIYRKIGASGSGSWSKVSALVYGPTPTIALGTVTVTACNTDPAVSIGGTALSPVLNFSFPACNYNGGIPLPTPDSATRGGVFALAPVTHYFMTGLGDNGRFSSAQPSIYDLAPIDATSVVCNSTGGAASPTACTALPSTFTGTSGHLLPYLDGVNYWSSAQNIANAGVFTNTQYNTLLTSYINSPNPGAWYSSQQGGTYATDAVTGAIDIPVGATVHQVNGVAGYVRVQGSPAGVGVFGQCMMSAPATTGCWSLNTVAANSNGVTSTGYNFGFLGIEFDINVYPVAGGGAPSGNAAGVYIVGNSTIAPTGNHPAILIDRLSVGSNIPWQALLLASNGAGTYGIYRGAQATTNNSISQIDAYNSTDAGGVNHLVQQNSDANGNLIFTLEASKQIVANSGYVSNISSAGNVYGLQIKNTSTANVITKLVSQSFDLYDTIGTDKIAGQITLTPVDANIVQADMDFYTRIGDAVVHAFRLAGPNGVFDGTVAATQFLSIAAPPTLSACGTSPAISGFASGSGGQISTGTGGTACTLTFAAPFPNAAFCTITPGSQPTSVAQIPYVFAISKTAVTFSGLIASTLYTYTCNPA